MPVLFSELTEGTEHVVIDPSEVATGRTELPLNEGYIRIRWEGVDWGTAEIQAYMAEAERGELPVDYRLPNRKVSIPLILQTSGATFEDARVDLQQKVALLQREGGWLKRELRDGKKLYLDVVNATLRMGGHWFQAYQDVDHEVTLEVEAVPDFYGDEVELDVITETTAPEIAEVLQEGSADAVLEGDYPGRVRIEVSEDDGETQAGLLWGFRCRHYSSAATAALVYEADDLEALDAAAAAGGEIEHTNLGSNWTPVLGTNIGGTDFLTHTGSYRVWARVDSDDGDDVDLRFVWDVGDLSLPVENSYWTFPASGQTFIADLGEIRLDRVPVGDHRWQGQIHARGTTGGEQVAIKRLWFQPLDEGAGRLRAPVTVLDGLVDYSARDEFNQTSGALDTKTAPVGGAWADAGDASSVWSVDTGLAAAKRTVTSGDVDADLNTGGYAISGVSAMTSQAVRADMWRDTATSGDVRFGVLARYADTSNWLLGHVLIDDTTTNSVYLCVTKRVAGSVTELARVLLTSQMFQFMANSSADRFQTMLVVDARGRWSLFWGAVGSVLSVMLSGTDSALATGGALDDGKPGFYLAKTGGASNEFYVDNFQAWVPVTDAVMFADQSAELRTEGIYRATSDGNGNGPVSHRTGDLPRLPPSGMEGRPVELFLKSSRGDLESLPDSGVDDVSAQVFARPSWLFVPSV